MGLNSTRASGDGNVLRLAVKTTFIPEGGNPLPMNLAAWNWSGGAYYIAGNPDGCALCGQPTVPQAAIGADYCAHPQWTNNFQTIEHDSTYWTFQTNWFNLCQ